MTKRRQLLGGMLGALGLGKAAQAQQAEATQGPRELNAPILFVQQDTVLEFNLQNGRGQRVGTATGRLNGTTMQSFQFLPVPPPEFAADDLMVLSDVDGDQILFRAQVTGRFLQPFGDAQRGPVAGLGGPFSGTYEVTRATGKYAYLVGRKFPCKGLGMNPADQRFTGSVYVEVYTDRFDDRI